MVSPFFTILSLHLRRIPPIDLPFSHVCLGVVEEDKKKTGSAGTDLRLIQTPRFSVGVPKRFFPTLGLLPFFPALAALLSLFPSPAHAARFIITTNGPSTYVGETLRALVELEVEPGERVYGGAIELKADPERVFFSDSQEAYASDMETNTLTVFPASGTIRFSGINPAPLEGKTPFLLSEIVLSAEGASFLSLTGSVQTDPEGKSPPKVVSPSIYKVFAAGPGEFNPFMSAALDADNARTQGDPSIKPEFIDLMRSERGTEVAAASDPLGDLGLFGGGALKVEEVQTSEEADVAVGFSRREIRVGKDQYIRIDLNIEKFPPHTPFIGGQFHLKYDPEYMFYVDSKGRERTSVELLPPFNFSFIGEGGVDKQNGLLNVMAAAPLDVKDEDLPKPPLTLATMYFKAKKEGATSIEILNDDFIKFPPHESLKMKRAVAAINVASTKGSCDPGLPASLCEGSYSVTGETSATITTASAKSGSTTTGTSGGGTNPASLTRKFQSSTVINIASRMKQGVKIDGKLIDQPNLRGRYELQVETADFQVNFGDFNATLAEGKLTRLTGKMTGIQTKYQGTPGWKLGALQSQRRSTNQSVEQKGSGRSDYTISANGLIVFNSLSVYLNGRPLKAPADYTFDYSTRKIVFSKVLTNQDTFTVNFETSSDFFSTGDIRGYRLDYAPEGKPFKAGATWLQTQASTIQDSVEITAIDEKVKVTPIPDSKPFKAELSLTTAFVVPDSVSIDGYIRADDINDAAGQFYFEHFDAVRGRIHWRDKDAYDKLEAAKEVPTVRFRYYDPVYLNRRVEVLTLDDLNSVEFNAPMVMGSEKIFVSKDDNSDIEIVEGLDQAVCHDADGDFNLKETDDEECEGFVSTEVYTIDQDGDRKRIRFSSDPRTEGIRPYLKIIYTEIPVTLDTTSVFDKTQLGYDVAYSNGGFAANAEFASTESDIGDKEIQVVDELLMIDLGANALEFVQGNPTETEIVNWWYAERGSYNAEHPPWGFAPGAKTTKCNYLRLTNSGGDLLDKGRLACRIGHQRISGTIVAVSFETGQSIPIQQDKDRGVIAFDITIGEANRIFLPGKTFELNYKYKLPKGVIVAGNAMTAEAAYKNSRVAGKVSLDQSDTTFAAIGGSGAGQGSLQTKNLRTDLSVTDVMKGAPILEHALNGMNYSYNRTQIARANDVLETSEGTEDRLVQRFDWDTRYLRGISLTLGNVGLRNLQSTTPVDSKGVETGLGFAVPLWRDKLSATVSRSRGKTRNELTGVDDLRTAKNEYGAVFRQSAKSSLDLKFSRNETTPSNRAATEEKGIAYTLKFKPTHYFDVTANSNRRETSIIAASGSFASGTTQMNVTDDFIFNFIDFGRAQKPVLTWRVSESSPTGTQTKGARAENMRFATAIALAKNNKLTLRPEIRKETNSPSTGADTVNDVAAWQLDYSPGWKWFPLFSLTNTHNSRSTQATAAKPRGEVSSDTVRNTRFNFLPFKNLKWNMNFVDNLHPTNPSSSFNTDLNYTFGSGLSLASSLSSQKQGSKSSSKNQTFTVIYKVTPKTNFDLTYSSNQTRNQGAYSSTSALQSKFKRTF